MRLISLYGMFTVLRLRICSNRWAKPERPAGSCFEPTSYHIDTMTLGVEVSRMAITRRPLASLRSVNFIAGTDDTAAALPACAGAAAGRDRMVPAQSADKSRR